MRSLLFAPANRLEMLAKFARIAADLFVLDLEDAVPAASRPATRAQLREAMEAARRGGEPRRIFVRVNPARSADFAPDLRALRDCGADGVVLPKAESADDIQCVQAALGTAAALPIIAGVESIGGVLHCRQIAAADGVAGLYFGAEDFAAEMGARRTLEGQEVLYARSRVVLAAKAARVIALDQVVVQVRDEEQFRRDSQRGRDLGYDGKMCLLPRQVELANELFGPTAQEVDYARRLIAAYEEAKAQGRGAIEFEGGMVDEPLLKRAAGILAAAASSRR